MITLKELATAESENHHLKWTSNNRITILKNKQQQNHHLKWTSNNTITPLKEIATTESPP